MHRDTNFWDPYVFFWKCQWILTNFSLWIQKWYAFVPITSAHVNFTFDEKYCYSIGQNVFSTIQYYLSLLNKVPRVPGCLSVWVPKCPSSVRVTKCPSTLSARVPKCLFEYPSTQVPYYCPCAQVPKCPSRVLWVSAQSPLQCYSSKKIWNIAKNELVNSFIGFLKTFQNAYYYITLIVFSFLGDKLYKFYHILLVGFNHSKWFQKLSLNVS